ncbi:MAG: biotin--[acetyl-CoA-carboxylase] ligase [Spirochaetia bacterium]
MQHCKLEITNPFGGPVLYKKHTGSTMNDARNFYALDFPRGSVAAAGYQSSGRGRRPGRIWESRAGQNLLFTLILGMNDEFKRSSLLPLGAGLGVCLCLERYFGITPELKWPNDVLVNRKKISGILCERRKDVLYVGIGLNCGSGFSPGGICLRELGHRDAPLDILPGLLAELYSVFSMPPRKWLEPIRVRLHKQGEPVRLAFPDGRCAAGEFAGIDEDGGLLLKTSGDGTCQKYFNGELLDL